MKLSSVDMGQARVLSDWAASYDDPIILSKNDPVQLTGRTDIWEGHLWLWAIAPDGRAGWIPDTLIEHGVSRADYSAQELTCATNEILTTYQSTHGWTWCMASDGRFGWVPQRCLSPL